jgi:hypothetical protein
MIEFNVPVRYMERVSPTGCSERNYTLVVKRGIFGRCVLKIYSGYFKEDQTLTFKVATWNIDVFKEIAYDVLTKKYPIFTIYYEDLYKLLGI